MNRFIAILAGFAILIPGQRNARNPERRGP